LEACEEVLEDLLEALAVLIGEADRLSEQAVPNCVEGRALFSFRGDWAVGFSSVDAG
jgi:hypothetical protein